MKHSPITPARGLLLDCDGVLLSWLRGFVEYARPALSKPLDPSGPNTFAIEDWLGLDRDACHAMISDFNEGDGGGFGRLEPMPGAVEVLQAAWDAGRKMTVITACSSNPAAIAQREQNLRNVFGDIFEDIHAVDLMASKRDLLASYDTMSWVEDKVENALLGAEVGHYSYILRTSYSIRQEGDVTHPRLTWVDGWDCIRRKEGLI